LKINIKELKMENQISKDKVEKLIKKFQDEKSMTLELTKNDDLNRDVYNERYLVLNTVIYELEKLLLV